MSKSAPARIVIVGGGSGGITVAARLALANRAGADRPSPGTPLQIQLVEPSDKHYYQPLWTLVGAGIFPREESERNEADLIPPGVDWVRDSVETFEPEHNRIRLRSGATLGYDFLVVSPGMQIFWDRIPGLSESLGRGGVCSNYDYQTVGSTWEAIRNFSGGTAVFTQPAGAIKCGGAPQKICYLADAYFRQSGVRDRSEIVFATATANIFAVEKYARALERVVQRKSITARFGHELIELRPDRREAVFRQTAEPREVIIRYDMIHVTPPMGSPRFVANSPLADADGWVEVHKHTLQHTRYPNVFSLGDASSLPTSKTGAAIRKQAPVLVDNLLACLAGGPLLGHYNGYTSCPLVTDYDRLILAEFDYDKQPVETFPFDQSQERLSMFLLKKYALPNLYWHGMLRGRA